MKNLTEAKKKQIWEEVREEFPDDQMMQEIHYTRLVCGSHNTLDKLVEGLLPGRGEKVIVTTPSSRFVTILEDGVNNPSVQKALARQGGVDAN